MNEGTIATNVSDTATTNHALTNVTITMPTRPRPEPTRDLFDVEVDAANVLRLIPRTALAQSLLAMWLHGDCRRSLISIGLRRPGEGHFGAHADAMEFAFEMRPMLTGNGDPYYTGRSLTPEQLEACKDALAKLDAKRAREARAARATPRTRSSTKRATKRGRTR